MNEANGKGSELDNSVKPRNNSKGIVSQVSDILAAASEQPKPKANKRQADEVENSQQQGARKKHGEPPKDSEKSARGNVKKDADSSEERGKSIPKEKRVDESGDEFHSDAVDGLQGHKPITHGDDDEEPVERHELPGDEDDGDPLDMDRLAAELEVDRKHLYKLKIPLGDGEYATLSELKDNYVSAAELAERKERIADYDRDTRLASLRAEQELAEVVRMLPNIPPKVMQAAQAKLNQRLEVESRSLLRLLPGWKNPAIRASDTEKHLAFLDKFGLSKADYQSITDHRVIYLVHEAARMSERIQRASQIDEGSETPRGAKPAGRSSARSKQSEPSGPAKTTSEAVQRIGKLLRS